MARSTAFVRPRVLRIPSVAHSLKEEARYYVSMNSGGLTVDFGILLMRKMDDETCWSEVEEGLGGDGRGGWGSEGIEWGRLGVRMRAMWWEVVAGRNVIE